MLLGKHSLQLSPQLASTQQAVYWIIHQQLHDQIIECGRNRRIELAWPSDWSRGQESLNIGPRQPASNSMIHDGTDGEEITDCTALVGLLNLGGLIGPRTGVSGRTDQIVCEPTACAKVRDFQTPTWLIEQQIIG